MFAFRQLIPAASSARAAVNASCHGRGSATSNAVAAAASAAFNGSSGNNSNSSRCFSSSSNKRTASGYAFFASSVAPESGSSSNNAAAAAATASTASTANASNNNNNTNNTKTSLNDLLSKQEALTSPGNMAELDDDEVVRQIKAGAISLHNLEHILGDCTRAVRLRRRVLVEQLEALPAERRAPSSPRTAIAHLPYDGFNEDSFYRNVLGANAEAVIGFVPLPVGVVGPLRLDGRELSIPLATTEGALVASTNRGCRAITESGGAVSVVSSDGMTRAPVVHMPSLAEAGRLKSWVAEPENLDALRAAFASTTRFGKLLSVTCTLAGRTVYVRFKCSTGDAMGMNMISKGVNEAINVLQAEFPGMEVLGLSGNVCTDKKAAAINWINGRGKGVVCEARITADVLARVLKTNAAAMVKLNIAKNLVGSAMAGAIGGFNAHASNLVSAVFLATGQDVAQNVESSSCLTSMEADGEDLIISVTMPSIEVGTVGGGTSLSAQAACLDLLGVRGASKERPGANAEALARVVSAAVLAGELSLMSALTSGDLVSGHMKHNRKPDTPAGNPEAAAAAAAATPSAAAGRPATARAYSSSSASLAVPYSRLSPGRHFFATADESVSATSRAAATEAAVESQEPLLSTP